MTHATLGLAFIVCFALFAATISQQLRIGARLRQLILAGLVVRVLGAIIYLYGIGAYYGGGDYLLYFNEGLRFSHSLWDGVSLFSGDAWAGQWWGTGFVIRVTGVLLAVFGPSLPGAFLLFALMAYVGILSLALAFHRAYPEVPTERYFVWIALFPSLWFWPSSLGKDALVLMGIGVAALGFVGKRGHVRWLSMAIGVALVFAVRPHVAATLSFGIVAGNLLGSAAGWSVARVVQGIGLLVGGISVLALSSGVLGVELFQPDQVEAYMETKSIGSSYGGSAVDVGTDGVGVWMAPMNIFFRPFLWEARGITSFLAAVEVVVIWIIAWSQRRRVAAFYRAHRRSRLFWMAVAFVGLYAVALGLSAGNIGIIARQRIHILPFVFLLFAGASSGARPGTPQVPRTGRRASDAEGARR